MQKIKLEDNYVLQQEGQHPLTGQRAANFRLLATPTAAPPHFSAHVYCGQTVAHLSNC